jgi:hypothetical protein
MTDFLAFSKNPRPVDCTEKWDSIITLQFLILFIILGSLGSALPYILSKFLMIEDKISNLTFEQRVIQGLLIAPIMEELIFRLLLIEKKVYFLINAVTCTALIIVAVITGSNISAIIFIIILGITTTIAVIHIKGIRDLYSPHTYKYLYWCSILLYGLLHGLNFRFINNWYTFLIPFLTMPQIFLGFILSYIRVKYGILYSVIFHFIVNTQILFTH